MTPIIFDDRWIADHGIGRVARTWLSMRSGWARVGAGPSPAAPTDPLWLARRLVDEERVFLSPAFNAPLRSRAPFFITIHDMCYVDMADVMGWAKKLYFKTLVRDRAHHASGIITVSEFSRSRICEVLGIPEARVHIAAPGVSAPFSTHGPKRPSKTPYVLCVSNGSPHKNEQRTLDAFASSALGRTHELIFSGAPRPLALTDHKVRVSFTGRLTDADLAAMYRGASMLVFASLYEGFGLPVAEAMACGTPVVCSRAGSLPEIAGEAAVLVNPLEVSSIRESMERLATNPDLARSLRHAGLSRAGRMNWSAGMRALDRAIDAEVLGASLAPAA